MDDVITSIEELPPQQHSHAIDQHEEKLSQNQVDSEKTVNVIIRKRHRPMNPTPLYDSSFSS